mmetsp:Transcript_10593/g.17793  ORF Transcript_10593/g.17793 Transcript_10593/m.17793 type:complete len:145 (+) Transcript_10593:1417-1851(+)
MGGAEARGFRFRSKRIKSQKFDSNVIQEIEHARALHMDKLVEEITQEENANDLPLFQRPSQSRQQQLGGAAGGLEEARSSHSREAGGNYLQGPAAFHPHAQFYPRLPLSQSLGHQQARTFFRTNSNLTGPRQSNIWANMGEAQQ